MAQLKQSVLQLKPNQIKASTLLEVIVAMVIIMVVFVIATGIYTNIMKSSPSIKQQQGRAMTFGLIQQSIAEKDWLDKTVLLDSIVLQKTVTPYLDYPDLLLVTVVATARGKEIGQSRQIIKQLKARKDEPQ